MSKPFRAKRGHPLGHLFFDGPTIVPRPPPHRPPPTTHAPLPPPHQADSPLHLPHVPPPPFSPTPLATYPRISPPSVAPSLTPSTASRFHPSLSVACLSLSLSLSLFLFHSPCISKYIPFTPSIVTAIPPCPSPRHTSQSKLRFEPIHVILHQMNLMRKQTRHLAGARQSGPPAGLARRPSGRPPAQLLHDADGASH